VLETHLDNDRGETIGHASQRLMAEGALDVVSIPAQMKKDRPAQVLKVLAKPEDADRLERILFEETSTLGIRRSDTRRDALHRHFDTVETRFGPINVKVAHLPGGTLRATPEYEDCRKAAEKHGVPCTPSRTRPNTPPPMQIRHSALIFHPSCSDHERTRQPAHS
jgi:pyridinium-3,5-bisthiocarboxylic acid mononucleotide nickel chelatase